MARKPGAFTSRTKARKRAADVVFEADQRKMLGRPEGLRDLLDQRLLVSAAETPLPDYSVQIVEGVADNLTQIDQLLEKHAKVVSLDRLPGVDLAVMRVAVWEIIGNEDVESVIAIDEAVAIVKSISTDRSPGFVNAVLDAIRHDLEKSTPVVVAAKASVPAVDLVEAEEELDELLNEY